MPRKRGKDSRFRIHSIFSYHLPTFSFFSVRVPALPQLCRQVSRLGNPILLQGTLDKAVNSASLMGVPYRSTPSHGPSNGLARGQ